MAATTAVAAPVAAAAASVKKAPKQLPAPNSDFYELYETLNAEELATVKRVRKPGAARLCPNGDCTHRPVVRDVHRRAHRPGDGLHLHRRIGGAEAEVA